MDTKQNTSTEPMTFKAAQDALFLAKTIQRNAQNSGTPAEVEQKKMLTRIARENYEAVLARKKCAVVSSVRVNEDADEDTTPYGYDSAADAEWMNSRVM